MAADFSRLRELASRLPAGLVSDWEGTNHYELQATGDNKGLVEYFWLMVGEGVGTIDDPCHSEPGHRLGLIMDIAAEVGRLKDEGDL